MEDANEEPTVYLVEVESEDELAEWLRWHHQELFEAELNSWYTDPSLWPSLRTLGVLKEWCSIELHTIVEDWGDSPLDADDFEDGV